MRITSVQREGNPTMKARLVCNSGELKSIVKSQSDLETRDIVKKISVALAKHPSPVLIHSNVQYGAGFWGARGVISSKYVTYYDVEPAQNNKKSPIKNILRRILDPENKECFNSLVGQKYAGEYDNWWQKNIEPIWGQINTNFREKTFFNGNYDKQFNEDFRNKEEKTWKRLMGMDNP